MLDAQKREPRKTVRLMFEDEAGFGRINKPKPCWCPKGTRPSVPCHHIRERRYAFGAVEPLTGENFFLTMSYCNTACTNTFLAELSKQYPDDIILLVCDGAAWHKSKTLVCPENIQLLSIPPYTPEMNPILAPMSLIFHKLRLYFFPSHIPIELHKRIQSFLTC